MKDAAIFYVYILFRLNGIPCYVGKGHGDRWVRHQGRAKHCNRHLGSIIDQGRAAGKALPRIKVCEHMLESDAFALERLLIGLIGRGEDGPLVNLTDGGDGSAGYKPPRELVERIAAKNRGRTQSTESNALRSAALKGRVKSSEHIAAAGSAQRGGKKSSGWWSTEEGRAKQAQNNHGGFKPGHKHSDAAIAKIKEARARQPRHISPATQFKPGHAACQSSIDEGKNQ